MTRSSIFPAAVILAVLTSASTAAADVTVSDKYGIKVGADIRNIFFYRSDADFDRNDPFYNPKGSWVGILGTDFKPDISWNITEKLKIYFEFEIGWNYWNVNYADTRSQSDPTVFVWRSREIYTEGLLFNDFFGFKVGYQLTEDPTQLFLRYYLGGLRLWLNTSVGSIYMIAGFIPFSNGDIKSLNQTNFDNSNLFYGLYGSFPIGGHLILNTGVYGLYDATVYQKPRILAMPIVNLIGIFNSHSVNTKFIIDLIGQFGRNSHNAYDGSDQTVRAWAGQGHVTLNYSSWFQIDINLLNLSPDGPSDHGKVCTAFLYSDWNRSSMILLAQDKDNEWYDSLDGRISQQQGIFYLTRPGYIMGDFKASFKVTDWFTPAIASGAGWVLQPKAALGHSFVGWENDLFFYFYPLRNDHLVFYIIGQYFLPGQAASALVNRINRYSVQNVYSAETVLEVKF